MDENKDKTRFATEYTQQRNRFYLLMSVINGRFHFLIEAMKLNTPQLWSQILTVFILHQQKHPIH